MTYSSNVTPTDAPYRVRVIEMIKEVTFEETDGLSTELNCHDAKWDMQKMFSRKLGDKFCFSVVLVFHTRRYLVSQILFLYKKFRKFAFFY